MSTAPDSNDTRPSPPRRGPSRLVLVVAAVMIGAFAVAFVNSAMRNNARNREQAEANRVMLSNIERQRAAVQAEQKEAFEKNGSMSLSADRANRLLDSLEESTKETDTPEARMLRISTGVMRELAGAATEYEKRVNEVVELGGLDGAGITAEADLDARISKWAGVAELASKLTAQTKGMPDRVKAELEKAKLGDRAIAGFMNGMNSGGRFALFGELRDREEEIIAGNREQLQVLKRAYGRWRYDKDDDRAVFQDDADSAAYTAAAEKAAKAAEAQAKVQKRMMNIGAQPANPSADK